VRTEPDRSSRAEVDADRPGRTEVDAGRPGRAEAGRAGRHRTLGPGAGGSGGWGGLGPGLWYCLKVFLALRVGLSVVALIAVAVLPHAPPGGSVLGPGGAQVPGPVGVPGWPAHAIASGWGNALTWGERFDALWFLRIATAGYSAHDGSAAFFPLFPLLVRWVSALLGGHPLAAAVLVSNLACLGALALLYALGRTEVGEDRARAAVAFTAVFPTSFFLLAPYSESLFLLLTLGALWGARRRRWWVAAVAGALAALTRNLGVLLVLPLAAEAVHQLLEDRRRTGPGPRPSGASVAGPLAASLGPLAGLAVYLGYWRRLGGDWLAPLHQQAGWQRQLTNPGHTLADATRDALRFLGVYPGGYHLLDWVIGVPVLLLAVYVVFRFRPAYGIYVWASILVPMTYIFAGRPLMSFPRFALPLFPLSWALAGLTSRSRGAREAALACSAGLLAVLFLLFVNWYYVF
jgi:Mannosyltransferase (PIG-V)